MKPSRKALAKPGRISGSETDTWNGHTVDATTLSGALKEMAADVESLTVALKHDLSLPTTSRDERQETP